MSKSKRGKLFKSEEELFNEAMKSEIEARKNYEEYKKEIWNLKMPVDYI